MNYVKEAEELLKKYRNLERSVKNLENRLGKLHSTICPTNLTQHLDPTGVRGSRNDEAMNQLFEYAQIKGNLKETQDEIDEIEDNLKFISEEKGCEFYGDLLKLWYIERKEKEEIAEELSIGRTTVYNHKEQAIRNFSIVYFGIRALKQVI